MGLIMKNSFWHKEIVGEAKYTKEEILNILVKILPEYKDVQCVGLFGSYSRDEAGSESDVDILYDLDCVKYVLNHVLFERALWELLPEVEIRTLWYLENAPDYTERKDTILKDIIWVDRDLGILPVGTFRESNTSMWYKARGML